MGRASTVRRWIQYSGVRSAASVLSGYVAMHALGPGIRRCTAPALGDFARSGGSIATSAAAFLQRMGFADSDIERVLDEFRHLTARLAARYEEVELRYPRTHGVETETSAVLYGLARLLRARTVVETGVADGRSSWLILAALERNGHGVLHSFDIASGAGGLVGQHPQWRLEILSRRQPEASLREALRRIDEIDLFFHDSDHRYLPQLFEYEAAWPKMAPGGVLASDDVNTTPAFLDFCKDRGQPMAFLFDSRKMAGAIRMHGASPRPDTTPALTTLRGSSGPR